MILSLPISTFFGTADLGFHEVLTVYRYHLFGDVPLEDMGWDSIVWNLRLPRMLVAIAVGGGLAVTGCVMQAMTGNAMAEPYILGIQAGAAMFAALSIAFSIFSRVGVNLLAFIGAMVAMVVVYGISAGDKGKSGSTLVLTGISISMLCNAFTQLIIAFAPDNAKVKGIVFWMMGGLGGVRWGDTLPALFIYVLGFGVIYVLVEQLNILSMGSETAVILGVQIRRLNKILFVMTSLIVGVLVSISGSIGFVGLIVPHIVRRFVGSNHKQLIPVSALFGSLFLIWADTISRTVAAPKEVPIGVLTSLIGVPFFLFIMRKRNKGIGR